MIRFIFGEESSGSLLFVDELEVEVRAWAVEGSP